MKKEVPSEDYKDSLGDDYSKVESSNSLGIPLRNSIVKNPASVDIS